MPKSVRLSSIVAIASNRVIGKDNALIWHLPEDLKHFKRTTMGKPIIMGRKSFEALGSKPLPGRPHIIISRQSAPSGLPENVHYAPSIEEAVKLGETLAHAGGTDEQFITGGGEIYAQTLPAVDRLYLTILDRAYEGDTTFPDINWDDWNIVEKTAHDPEPDKDRPAFTIYTLDRR